MDVTSPNVRGGWPGTATPTLGPVTFVSSIAGGAREDLDVLVERLGFERAQGEADFYYGLLDMTANSYHI